MMDAKTYFRASDDYEREPSPSQMPKGQERNGRGTPEYSTERLLSGCVLFALFRARTEAEELLK